MSTMSNAEIRKGLSESHALLERLHQTLVDDHGPGAMIVPAYPDYAKNGPETLLARAKKKLDKRGYNVAFAGAMKAGKSTMINALVRAPGLLPAAVFECTLTTTKIGAPPAGQSEHVEVTYFSRDDAIRNILQNARYEAIFAKAERERLLAEYEPQKATAYIREKTREFERAGTHPEHVAELKEFVEALERHAARLGRVHNDGIENAPQYLALDAQKRGMGHLLCIKQVTIYKNNPIFSDNGIEIVDLPGTDSTNPRQRELTHAFMREADVVFLMLEPKGFTEAAQRITEKLQDYNQEIKNKIFVVLNRWDGLQPQDIKKDAIESLFINDIKARAIRWGLRPDRIYLTSALWEELRLRKQAGILDDAQAQSLADIERRCTDALNGLDGAINDDLLQRMRIIYRDGGVQHMREQMRAYLMHDIERERLKDVYMDLMEVYGLAKKMLEPERREVQQLLADARNRLFQVGKFVDEMIYKFDQAIVENVDSKIEKAVGKFVNEAKESLVGGVRQLLASDNRWISFQKIRAGINVPSPARIKNEAILKAKDAIADKIVDAVKGATVARVTTRLRDELGKLKNDRILQHFDKHLRTGFAARYERLVANMEHDIEQMTELRAMEEAWELQNMPMQAADVEGVWSERIEDEFRKMLQEAFAERVNIHMSRVGGVLARYYRQIMKKAMDEYRKIATDLSERARHAHDVPIPSITGEEKVDKKQRLCEYITTLDETGLKLAPLTAELTGQKLPASMLAPEAAMAGAGASSDWS